MGNKPQSGRSVLVNGKLILPRYPHENEGGHSAWFPAAKTSGIRPQNKSNNTNSYTELILPESQGKSMS